MPYPEDKKSKALAAGGHCPVCHSGEAIVVGDRDRRGEPLKSLFCLGCGLLRVDPLPSDEELRAYYKEQYRLDYKGVLRPKPYHVMRAARAASDRIGWLSKYWGEGRQWLDVGAGSGEFAYLMGRKGFTVTALEPNKGYGEYMRETLGLEVIHGVLEDLDARSNEFDGISSFHMLEHHPDPVAALQRMRRLLRAKGILAVEVPNAAFELIHPRSRFHRAHLVHFNQANLKMAAARAGFETLALESSSDGGVLWGVFRSSEKEVAIPKISAEKLSAWREAEEQRTAWQYYANPRIWAKTLKRVSSLGVERWTARKHSSPKTFLAQVELP